MSTEWERQDTVDSADDFKKEPTIAEELRAVLEDMRETLIEDVFGSDGALSEAFDNYSPREGQVMMAEAVHTAFKKGKKLIVEGPTGTGKSLAYAVPAAFHTAIDNKRAVIVTSNIALQEQLMSKDLPLLQEVLPWKFDFHLAKGRSNYLCLDTVQSSSSAGYGSAKDDKVRLRLIDWARETKTGDRSELDFDPGDKVWSKFSVGSDDCKGRKCHHYESCFAMKARGRLAEAHVIVTNYHMIYADVHVRGMTGGKVAIIPDRDFLILDECHRAADIASDCFGFKVTEGSCNAAARDIPMDMTKKLSKKVREEAADFFGRIGALHDSDHYSRRMRYMGVVDCEQLCGVLEEVASRFKTAVSLEDTPGDRKELYQRKERRACRVVENIRKFTELAYHPHVVYFIEKNEKKGTFAICSKPIHAGAILSSHLFGYSKSVIATSATIAIDDSMDYTAKQLGLEDADQLKVPSPFDWDKQAVMVFQNGMPEPSGKSRGTHILLVSRNLVDIIRRARGRTLALFTSNAAMNRAYEEVKAAGLPYTLYKQNEGLGRMQLLQRFREDVNSVLFGVESFWAGVDIPGESLSVVTMDKIPFANLNDPVLDALEELEGNTFMTHSVPRAIIGFRQGLGRLIRTVEDRGVIVLFDSRVHTKNYGSIFRRAVPTNRVVTDWKGAIDDVLGT